MGNGTNGQIQLFSWTDYNPLGSVMPGRNYTTAPGYRYGYQGQFSEMDNETGYNSFDLRMYDPIKGRWDCPDPLHQYHSPYKAMSNNFVGVVDPDGGVAGGPGGGGNPYNGLTDGNPGDWGLYLLHDIQSAANYVSRAVRTAYSNIVDGNQGLDPRLASIHNLRGARFDGSDLMPTPLTMGVKITKGVVTVYRAVSKAELDDIAKYGLRVIEGGYESKLFAPTIEEAAKFGKNNYVQYDQVPNHIIEVQVPYDVWQKAYKFPADGMNAINIPASELGKLSVKEIPYSPLVK